jgi:hypothetical protein
LHQSIPDEEVAHVSPQSAPFAVLVGLANELVGFGDQPLKEDKGPMADERTDSPGKGNDGNAKPAPVKPASGPD